MFNVQGYLFLSCKYRSIRYCSLNNNIRLYAEPLAKVGFKSLNLKQCALLAIANCSHGTASNSALQLNLSLLYRIGFNHVVLLKRAMCIYSPSDFKHILTAGVSISLSINSNCVIVSRSK